LWPGRINYLRFDIFLNFFELIALVSGILSHGFGLVGKDQEFSDNILITGKDIRGNVAGLFHVVTGPLMHGTLDSDINEIETEVFVFLAVLDKEVKAGSDFWLNVLDGKQFEKG
jgi:hypothetical protein